MKISFFHIDAFTQTLFAGNPAFVAVVSEPLSDEKMQNIAYENNLPATVFLQKNLDGYAIRWFTMEESDLCGHGSLAAAYVVFNFLEPELTQVKFTSKKGLEVLVQQSKDGTLTLSFPPKNPIIEALPEQVTTAIGLTPLTFLTYQKERCLMVLENEEQVRRANPNLEILAELPWWGYVLTARGQDVDFVSRTFYPRKKALQEDYVTGASHCLLAPYWGSRLQKNYLTAHQISSRLGVLACELKGDNVLISGHAVLYARGELFLD